MLAAALTPILIFAAVQAVLDANQARYDRRNALLGLSDRAIDRVEQALKTSEVTLAIFEDDIASGACKAVYDRAHAAIPAIVNTLYFDESGTALCAATQESGFEMEPSRWTKSLGSPNATSRTDAFQSRSGRWIMGLYRKQVSPTGDLQGLAGFAVHLESLGAIADRSDVDDDVEIALADATGRVFSSDRFTSIDQSWLEEAASRPRGRLFVSDDQSKKKMDIVVRPIGTNRLYAVISRPSPGWFSEFSVAPARTVGLPLVAFSVTLLAAWLALDRLVLRWLSRFRGMARRFGAGEYAIEEGRFADAPQEMAEFGAAFQSMAVQIAERDASLNEAIGARDAAVKEIHHRVKNNLQIVTSFLSLQARGVKDEEARAALADARHRIDALSIVHQTLYQHERLETVRLKPFLEVLLQHLSSALGMAEADVTLTQSLQDAERKADDAIPLALFLVEAVTNTMKYAFGEEGGEIKITLSNTPEGQILHIDDDGEGADLDANIASGSSGLGSRLMAAFAKQLGGELTFVSNQGEGFWITLTLPARLS